MTPKQVFLDRTKLNAEDADGIIALLAEFGFKIVLAHPTTKMICAALDDHDKPRPSGRSQSITEMYAAMVAASPQ